MKVLEITTRIGCKGVCEYCPQPLLLREYSKRSDVYEMSFSVFKRCIDKVPADVHIIFCGMCEPWLNPECTAMVLYADRKKHRVSIDTTLLGMKQADIEALAAVKFFYVSVHLPSAEGYENIPVDGEYLTLLEAVRTKIKAENFGFNWYGETLHPAIRLPEAQRCPLFSRSGNIKIKGKELPARRRGSIECLRGLRWNVLLPNGDVVLCSADYGMKHVLGNLLTSDYESLFSGAPFSTVKKGMRNESLDILCRYCELYATQRVGFWDRLLNRSMLQT